MDFDWSDEQLKLRQEALSFGAAALAEHVERDDRDGRFPREKWDALGSWGLFGLTVPEEHGGSGLDPMTALAVTEGLAEGCPDSGLVFSAIVQTWVLVPTFMRFATDEQRNRYLPGLVSGSLIGALAVTEPDSGSDAFAMKTRADPVDGGWRLRGSKTYITNAPVADLVICFARTGEGGAMGGVSAFLLETGARGVTLGPPLETQGLRTAPLGEIGLDDVLLSDESVLGRPGFGLAVFNEAMEWERSFVMSLYVGVLERQLKTACAYARRRQAFGGAISKQQSVADTLVDMRVRLETSRLLLYRACWLKAQGRSVLEHSSMAKLWVAECAVANSLDAIQVHGALGYATEAGIERDLRDAVGARIHSGTSQLQKVMIARSMQL
ncbi:acyl-CoA dehydrogenase family protein [Geodermatophilus sp. CPCC 205506]|uniref:acyl-CoA dehydrogenase family protein n=1 Tax=Geodermatophilus sp. CPCC 205506 TaxID=2936596 RepID=UPI003EEDF386